MRGGWAREEDRQALEDFLAMWREDPQGVKLAFMALYRALDKGPGVRLHFVARPGISYSMRASLEGAGPSERPCFAVVDVVDAPPSERWLSVCFYADSITDPEEEGNLIPNGLFDEDGYCFDLARRDEALMAYLEVRITEAYMHGLGRGAASDTSTRKPGP